MGEKQFIIIKHISTQKINQTESEMHYLCVVVSLFANVYLNKVYNFATVTKLLL